MGSIDRFSGGTSTQVSLFGNYYPHFERAANVTTCFSYFLSLEPDVGETVVFGNQDSEIPEFLKGKIDLKRIWKADSPVTLVKVYFALRKRRSKLIIFNIFLTSFGTSRLSNLLGLFIPIFLSLNRKTRVLTYMHNFLESQNLTELGYRPNLATRRIVKQIERILIKRTTAVATLPSISRKISEVFGIRVESGFVSFIDGAISYLLRSKESDICGYAEKNPILLIFGAWGPQKDVVNIIRLIDNIIFRNSVGISVIVSGHINRNFKHISSDEIESSVSVSKRAFRFIWNPPEEEIYNIFNLADAIILPYKATGGYSGVLNLAAFYELDTLSYENEVLREQSELLSYSVKFIDPNNQSGIESWISGIQKKKLSKISFEEKLKRARNDFHKVLLLVREEWS